MIAAGQFLRFDIDGLLFTPEWTVAHDALAHDMGCHLDGAFSGGKCREVGRRDLCGVGDLEVERPQRDECQDRECEGKRRRTAMQSVYASSSQGGRHQPNQG